MRPRGIRRWRRGFCLSIILRRVVVVVVVVVVGMQRGVGVDMEMEMGGGCRREEYIWTWCNEQ